MTGAIEELLKDSDKDIRVTCLDRWLVWDDIDEEWVVRESKYRSSKVTCVFRGKSLTKAVDILTE